MKPTTIPYTLLLAALLQGGSALAERADRDKPMTIESDTLRYDDAKQTSVFTGKVVLTKGTMLIRGARMDVRQDNDGNQFGVVTAEPGKLAFFRQKRDTRGDSADEFMEGEAELIEYDGKADVVTFTRRAVLRRYVGSTLNDEITGQVIVYNNTTSVMTVDGGSAAGSGSGRSGRVRAVLTPRTDDSKAGSSASGSSTPTAPLRKSQTLGGDKK